ncbi:MAG: hypothetical protein JXA64_11595 [Candidatus Fermentibacteraceae bacterium]|nr:hypothetical protein [Candidatus Fermentibacteraceae bacterium]MBN2609746.1 hypothetical protein [Candidatus Fermentibacteraceae bacterium]
MNRSELFLSAAVALLAVSVGCGGGPSISDELKMVPGLCFLHVHLDDELDVSLLPSGAGAAIPIWLVDSLHAKGALGISLLGVNLTDLSPQLLFLSRHVSPEEMAGIGASGFGCSAVQTGSGFDLVDGRGGILGSVAGRDGWACLITGSGSDRSTGRWLEMDEDGSLAADTDLVAISGSDADLNILISRNSISFLSVIPTGMLTRSQITYLNIARRIIADLGVAAARISADVTEGDPAGLLLEFRIVREGGNVASISAGFSDTGISPDSLISYLTAFYGLE